MVIETSKVEQFVKQQKPGAVFSFDTVVSCLQVTPKDTVNHALKKPVEANEIVHIKKGIYVRPKMSHFGTIPVDPSAVVTFLAKTNGANFYPYGTSVLNALGLTTQLSMIYSYIATKRIASFKLNNREIRIHFSRALKDADESITGLHKDEKKRVMMLWIALEYLGEREAAAVQDKLWNIYSGLSANARNQLVSSFRTKLNWAGDILE